MDASVVLGNRTGQRSADGEASVVAFDDRGRKLAVLAEAGQRLWLPIELRMSGFDVEFTLLGSRFCVAIVCAGPGQGAENAWVG